MLFIAFIITQTLFATNSYSISYKPGFGMALGEESDDRRRPTFVGNLDTGAYTGKFYYFGRTSTVVKESSFTIAGLQHFKIPSAPAYLSGGVGLTLLRDSVTISANDGTNSMNETESKYNIGVLLGVYAERKVGTVTLKAGWESHVYPAGPYASIFLVTGRRQFLSAIVSYTL